MQIKIRVTAGAKHDSIEKKLLGGKDVLFVSVRARAENGAANERVRELLGLHFETNIKNVRITNGQTSSNKTIEILNI